MNDVVAKVDVNHSSLMVIGYVITAPSRVYHVMNIVLTVTYGEINKDTSTWLGVLNKNRKDFTGWKYTEEGIAIEEFRVRP